MLLDRPKISAIVSSEQNIVGRGAAREAHQHGHRIGWRDCHRIGRCGGIRSRVGEGDRQVVSSVVTEHPIGVGIRSPHNGWQCNRSQGRGCDIEMHTVGVGRNRERRAA